MKQLQVFESVQCSKKLMFESVCWVFQRLVIQSLMMDILSLEGKKNVFDFNYQKINMFNFVQCWKNVIRVCSTFDKMVFSVQPMSNIDQKRNSGLSKMIVMKILDIKEAQNLLKVWILPFKIGKNRIICIFEKES